MGRKLSPYDRAARHIERAAAHLSEAETILRAEGHEQEARAMHTISHDAASALAQAAAHALKDTPKEGE